MNKSIQVVEAFLSSLSTPPSSLRRSPIMFYRMLAALLPARVFKLSQIVPAQLVAGLAVCACLAAPCLAQSIERDISAGDRPEISINNRNGRVRVVAAPEQQGKISIKAESTGAPVLEGDIVTKGEGNRVLIDVSARSERNRIDL